VASLKTLTGLEPGASAALDVTRFLLALCVAAAHWTQPYFQDGWPDITRLAVGAVGGFFVLSGFTIRLITAGGSFRLDDYFVKRLARLWSVMLPALLATVLLDSISAHIDPGFYLANWHQPFPLLGLLANAIFITQNWGMDLAPLSNGPFWSIGYEAWFYALYGLALARKPAWAAGAAILAGPNIWFLAALWLLGVGIYELVARADTRARRLALLGVALLLWMLDVSVLATQWEYVHRGYDHVLHAYFGFFHVGVARVGMGFSLIAGAVTFALSMLALLAAIDLVRPRIPERVMRAARALGEFTFPLYLLHFPLFVLCASVGFYDRHSWVEKVAIFAAVGLVISSVVPLTERLKRLFQKSLPVGKALRQSTARPA
jgi:peptidoglycan/LPS O-acetylase OafA/YrhL